MIWHKSGPSEEETAELNRISGNETEKKETHKQLRQCTSFVFLFRQNSVQSHKKIFIFGPTTVVTKLSVPQVINLIHILLHMQSPQFIYNPTLDTKTKYWTTLTQRSLFFGQFKQNALVKTCNTF